MLTSKGSTLMMISEIGQPLHDYYHHEGRDYRVPLDSPEVLEVFNGNQWRSAEPSDTPAQVWLWTWDRRILPKRDKAFNELRQFLEAAN